MDHAPVFRRTAGGVKHTRDLCVSHAVYVMLDRFKDELAGRVDSSRTLVDLGRRVADGDDLMVVDRNPAPTVAVE